VIRKLVWVALFFVGFLKLWEYAFPQGHLLKFCDENRHFRGVATALFVMARADDLFNNYPEARDLYQRIVDRYPRSRYAMTSLFGVAEMSEKAKEFRRAIAEYTKFLEEYPDSGPLSTIAGNNVAILSAR
jgi:tetratricopeptide (TPR) repeat protein